MASVVSVCAVVLFAAVGSATNIVPGLYCRDPDTGKLYPVNATWPSQSFCGNYTCKLRKKNTTETEYAPIQKINKIHIPNDKEFIDNDMAISSSDNSIAVTKKTDNDKQTIFHNDFFKTNTKETVANNKPDLKGNDGYLTEAEIKSIADMLYTVKKSDLEAILDIYNLAQDVYKEIDKAHIENINIDMEEIVNPEYERIIKKDNKRKDSQSYWYDPAHHNKLLDMSREEAKLLSTKQPPIDRNSNFFKGPLLEKDFGKLPYYYPLSTFQRLSTYNHHKPSINDLEKSPTETKPCTKAPSYHKDVSLPGYNVPLKKPDITPTTQTSTLLPYPFSYIYHYNVSGYPSYYYNYPWAHAQYNKHKNLPQPYYRAYIVQIPSYTPSTKPSVPQKEKPSVINNSGEDLVNRLRTTVPERRLPDWQTEPLSEDVLEEVRAHIIYKPNSFKPKPLKKNVKLERVGKVIKLDELARSKREVDSNNIDDNIEEPNNDELEVFIERTVCENSIEPGYFSMGNMSQPYPGCCPRKLEKFNSTREVIKVNY